MTHKHDESIEFGDKLTLVCFKSMTHGQHEQAAVLPCPLQATSFVQLALCMSIKIPVSLIAVQINADVKRMHGVCAQSSSLLSKSLVDG